MSRALIGRPPHADAVRVHGRDARWVTLTVAVRPETLRALDRRARTEGKSRSEIVRAAIGERRA